MNTTTFAKPDMEKKWHLIDAEGEVLGRLAVKIADLLRGRDKTIFTPHIDAGDYVVVTNAKHIKLTGKKMDDKKYMFYSGYRGNEKYVPVGDMLERRPEFVITNAVRGMLPKNKMSRQLLKKLRVFPGPEHTHEAQNPVKFEG